MNNPFSLEGKRAIVTGAARGLSRGMAEGLHDCGAAVVLLDIQDIGAQSAREMGREGAPVYFVKADLSDRADLKRGFEAAVKALGGGVDILINGAGIQRKIPVAEFPMDQWDLVLEINLNAPLQMSQLAGRLMMEQGYGKIINIASMHSFTGGEQVPAYAASKGAVVQLTKAMCNEWAAHGINVNAIAPGFMETEMNGHITGGNNPERYAALASRIPAGRWGTPDDIKYVAAFLAAPASDYVNGAVLTCDGGFLVK